MTAHFSETPKWLQGCFSLAGLFGLVFGGAIALRGIRKDDGVAMLIGLLLVLVTVPWPIFFALVMRARARLGKPSIRLDRETLRVGEAVRVEYVHNFSRAATINRLVAQLILRERVTFRAYDYHSKQTTTRTRLYDHVIQEIEAPGGSFLPGQSLRRRFTLRVPPDSMHSFAAPRNQLQWLVRITLDLPRQPDWPITLPIRVLPPRTGEVAP